MFNILFILHYYLFVMCKKFVRKNNYLFVLLNYLFPVFETNYLVLKKMIFFKKILCKYRQVWSCFEDLVMKKIMMKSKFNIDARFNIYSFFLFPKSVCMWLTWASYLFLHACIFWLAGNKPIITIKPSNGLSQINTPQDNYHWSPSGDRLWNHHPKWCIVAPV